MAKTTFTVKWIEGLKPGPAERWYWDQEHRGLGLRLNTKGEAWFVVQYRVGVEHPWAPPRGDVRVDRHLGLRGFLDHILTLPAE